jgi:hypothetical protein
MEDEATWEHEEELKADYPQIIPKRFLNLVGEILLRG